MLGTLLNIATSRALPKLALLASAVLAVSCALGAGAASLAPEPLTLFVVVDDASIATLGPLPIDRSVYAHAIARASELGARGLALKFLFDRPGSARSDGALATAIGESPVLLQVFPKDGSDDGISPKLDRADWDLGATADPYRFTSITYPLPQFISGARALGYVNVRTDELSHKVEVAGALGSHAISSLQVEIIELALGARARVARNRLRLGTREFALDTKGRIACDSLAGPPPNKIGIDRLLAGDVSADEIKGKVVVLGYDRKDSPTIAVEGEEMRIHTLFYRQVACLARLVAY
jgi:adenylate cyclase